MKFKTYYLFFLVFTSCSVLFPDGITFNPANYNYNYLTFNKRLDYNNQMYLLNPTNTGNSKLNIGSNLPYVVSFFNEKLGKNVVLKNDYKDKENKFLIPFTINYEITKDQILFLKENTDFNFIILSKTLYLNELKKNPLNNKNKARFYFAESGAMSFIKIIDITNNTIFLEMSCTGAVSISEKNDMSTGELEPKPYGIYKNNNALAEKTMKKLLKKIK